MISQDKRNLQLLYSILLFLVLSLFTVYPHIDILKYRSTTIIDNNAKDSRYISSHQLNQNESISTVIISLLFSVNLYSFKQIFQFSNSETDVVHSIKFEKRLYDNFAASLSKKMMKLSG